MFGTELFHSPVIFFVTTEAPNLKEAEGKDPELFLSRSRPVAAKAKQAHLTTLKHIQAPWWKKLGEEAGLNNKEEICKFWRAIGHSAHGKANIKHDRARRIVSNKKRIQIKKQKAFDKADRRIKDDEE